VAEHLLGLADPRVADHLIGERVPQQVRVDAPGDSRAIGDPTDEAPEGLRRTRAEEVVVLLSVLLGISPPLRRKDVLVGTDIEADPVDHRGELVAYRNPPLLAALADVGRDPDEVGRSK
jgi:hypothetical protein